MNGRNLIETVMDGIVLTVASGFLFFAYQQSTVKQISGYEIKAVFDDITGISAGSEVRLGGIKIGVVEALDLDPKTYRATAHMQIEDDFEIPTDSSASVASSGLLGDKFLKLEPGGQEEMLAEGGVITFTQSSVSFEELIGKFVFSGGGVESSEDGEAPASSDSSASTQETPDAAKEGADESGKENPFSLGF